MVMADPVLATPLPRRALLVGTLVTGDAIRMSRGSISYSAEDLASSVLDLTPLV